jgi:hypothetical protein
MGERRNALRIFLGKHEYRRTLGRSRSGWEENNKTDLQKGRLGRGHELN